ncbi:hypothetical protein PG994_008969 [Apiospora phragmitis]|uniref:F-box domain-containing protein n=1 Tax=Apiospora phragmitis TaxID=2905665 RepID=A0ABR1UKA6_9PEZI
MDGPQRKKRASGKPNHLHNSDGTLTRASLFLTAVVGASKKETRLAKVDEASQNFFLKLPDEIILRILHIIPDKISILVLRQTCRQFKRLCEDATLKYKLPILLSTAPFIASFHQCGIWPLKDEICKPDPTEKVFWLPDFANEKALEYCQLLWRDQMCSDCADLRQDPAVHERAVHRIYESMVCSGCKAYHPAFLFSRIERQKIPSRRVCIGRQGYISLCQHKAINWQRLERRGSSTRCEAKHALECQTCRRAGTNVIADVYNGYRLIVYN